MKILVRGRISLYEARGDFQFIAENMQEAGIGELQRAFEALRRKLHGEGLFDAAKKRDIPPLADHLAIITSATGAAIHDDECPRASISCHAVNADPNTSTR